MTTQHDEIHSLKRQLRAVKIHAAASTGVIITLALLAFTSSQKHKFDEIDVGRVNIVEPDGTVRLAISNKARFPDPVLDGKTYPVRSGPKPAGMIFFNDLGDEQGGLIWNGTKLDNGYTASASLTMDQWKQDQTVQLVYFDNSGQRWTGLMVNDRPDGSMVPLLDMQMAAIKLPEGAQRDSAFRAMQAYAKTHDLVSAPRIMLGQGTDRMAALVMNDRDGRARVRLSVDSAGIARLQFLDAAGNVTSELPARSDK